MPHNVYHGKTKLQARQVSFYLRAICVKIPVSLRLRCWGFFISPKNSYFHQLAAPLLVLTRVCNLYYFKLDYFYIVVSKFFNFLASMELPVCMGMLGEGGGGSCFVKTHRPVFQALPTS